MMLNAGIASLRVLDIDPPEIWQIKLDGQALQPKQLLHIFTVVSCDLNP
jgi:hypothetical protein